MASVVVLDAGALIALYDGKDPHHRWALQMFRDTVSSKLIMPVLTYSEVLVHPTRQGKVKQFERGIAGLGIEIQALEAESANQLADLRARTDLKMPDIVVLYEATKSKSVIATTDQQLAKEALRQNCGVLYPN